MNIFYSLICFIIPVKSICQLGFTSVIHKKIYSYIRLYELKAVVITEVFNKETILPHIKNLVICNHSSNDDIAYFVSFLLGTTLIISETMSIDKYLKLKTINNYIMNKDNNGNIYKIRYLAEITIFSIILQILKSPEYCF